jgi:hypothetical protein
MPRGGPTHFHQLASFVQSGKDVRSFPNFPSNALRIGDDFDALQKSWTS